MKMEKYAQGNGLRHRMPTKMKMIEGENSIANSVIILRSDPNVLLAMK